MHGKRLQLLVFLGAVAAVPEALVRSPDQQVAFQAQLVVQLLGVIVAAIGVAAAFSVLGLGLVRLVSRPLMRHAPTFVAWSFLRTPRIHLPWPIALLRGLRSSVDAVPEAHQLSAHPDGRQAASWRHLLVGLLAVGLGGAGLVATVMHEPEIPWLMARNTALMLAIHGLLLAIAGLPFVRLRAWIAAALPLLLTALVGLGARHPALLPWVDPAALLDGLAVLIAVGIVRPGPDLGLAQRLAKRGQILLVIAVLALIGAVVWRVQSPAALPVAALSLAVAALLVALYLLLQGQAKVSVPVFVSIVGVASGTWALIVVLSVMGGFAADLRGKMLVANAHALIESPGRAKPFAHAAQLSTALRKLPGVAAVSPQIRGDAILSSSFNVNNFVAIRGIDPWLPEVERELGGTMRTGSIALLRHPASFGADRAMTRRPATLPADLPPIAATETNQPTPADAESDNLLRALDKLPPGPSEPSAPQPDRPPMLAPTPLQNAPVDPAALPPDMPRLGDQPAPTPRGLRTGGLGQLGAIVDDPPVAAPESVDIPVPPGIVIGVELARTLQVDIGDKLEVVTPDGDVGPTGLRPRLRTFRVAGTFETGLYEADSKVAYMTLDEAARYFNLAGEANVMELRLTEPETPDAVLAQIRATLGKLGASDLEVIDWRQLNRSLFSALAFERLVIFLVLGLIILVAAFAIVSALTMVILQKHDSIAMLRAMGSSAGAIRSAFVQMGGVIGVIGTTAGGMLGLGTCILIETLGIALPEAYYVRTLPVRLLPSEVAVVIAASIGISLLATVFPARSAARLQPLEGLRHG